MKYSILALPVFLLVSLSSVSMAQVVCPPGYAPIGGGAVVGDYASGCAPLEGAQEEPEEIWEDRWGAIAIADGAFGYSAAMASEAEASQSALKACRSNANGQPCEVKLTYYNQCVALYWGDGGYDISHAETMDTAKSMSQADCNASYGNCRLFYSDCSMPERVQ